MKSRIQTSIAAMSLIVSFSAVAQDTPVPSQQCVPIENTASTNSAETTSTDTNSVPPEEQKGYYLVFPNKYYVSAGMGYLAPKDDESSDEPSEFTSNVLLGMQIDPNWALELNFYLDNEMEFDSAKLDYSQWEFTGRYDYNIHKRWGVYARAGVARWELEKTLPSDPHFEDHFISEGWSFTSEVGATFALSKRLQLNAGYTYTPNIGGSSTGSLSANRITLSATWKFGFDEHAVYMTGAD